jgi:tRNA(Ile)-lysidine synthase
MAERYHCRVFIRKFDTLQEAAGRKISIQMAARDLRYEWFEEVREAEGYDAIATGHHLDDQAETFMINLLRGTGIAGLHGIAVRKGKVIRPLLCATRAEIAGYAAEHHLVYREDSSNSELKYLRNRIRHELLPVLSNINPAFIDSLTETIHRLSHFEKAGLAALEAWKKELVIVNGTEWIIPLNALYTKASPSLFLWFVLSPLGFNETQVNEMLPRSGGNDSPRRFHSPTHTLEVRRDNLLIRTRKTPAIAKSAIINAFSQRFQLRRPIPLLFTLVDREQGFVIPTDSAIAALDAGKITFPLLLRRWEPGDSFYPLGMRKRKKLSDFFIDRKFTTAMKEAAWLLCSGNEIIWVVGHRIDHRFRITQKTRHILLINIL